MGWIVTPVMRPHHRLNRDAGDAGVGFGGPRARQNVRDSFAHHALAGEIEPDTADFGFVNDIRRQNLRNDGRSLCQ